MYAVYKNAISKYIIQTMNAKSMKNVSGVPKLLFKYSNPHSCDDMEKQMDCDILLTIRWMLQFFNIPEDKGKLLYPSLIRINSMEGPLIVKAGYKAGDSSYYLNNYKLCVQNNRGHCTKALLLLLVDPLKFVRRNAREIAALDDMVVKHFMLELENRAENIKEMHIKYWLITEANLVPDIMKIVIELYIGFIFNRDMMIECLNGEKLKI